ncbi:MAG: bifunctional methylenetetrahydrofolate dehydrogenase/methenyltetrahydrofolate cyclohydrolase FolD [Gemmatimonadaceae bacterium]|nr:bifunctional methylenetetrahydrofolate dehydrogenase/methenyltetrahydrofolate cyclohydrolase FolD [Gloeobacterales cyanobacterium ES-bin-141]
MPARILDGKLIAERLQAELATGVRAARGHGHRAPGLAVLWVGDNPASELYVRNKDRAGRNVGIDTSLSRHLSGQVSQNELLGIIDGLNADADVDGILVQLPLPAHLDSSIILNRVDPDKDCDGLHPINLGRLVRGEPGLRSCTPAGVMVLLDEAGIDLTGKTAIVIGRSTLVGKPVALMLQEKNATVIMAHSKTEDLGALTRIADVVVAAAGRPELVTGRMIKPGSAVIDVGINRIIDYEGRQRTVGDVDFESVREVAGVLTPVPRGVGPMTVTMLLHNTVQSYRQRLGLKDFETW